MTAPPDLVILGGRAEGWHGLQLRLAMGQLGVRYVIVVPADDPTGVYVRALRKIYGAPTEVTGGVQVWKIA